MIDFLSSVHWRASKAYENPGWRRTFDALQREAALDAHAWRDLNMSRLRQTLVFARARVPHYRDLFRASGFDPATADLPRDLALIPPLTRETLRTELPRLVDVEAAESTLIENYTGGSTGTPVTFYQNKWYETTSLALNTFALAWWGISPAGRSACAWGADREFHELSVRERFYQWRSRTRWLNAFRMNEREMHDFCLLLRRWRPPFLKGYATALDTLARFAQRQGFTDLRFRAVQSSAEMLRPGQRQTIQAAFQSPLYNFYGSREINNLAAECPEQHRLHMISAWRYIEVVDESGVAVPLGCPGNILVTDLSNSAMPLIRYRIEDMAALADAPCPCGRPMPVIRELLGRASEMVYAANNELVHSEFFCHLFYGRDDIRQFQIHQISRERLRLRYVPTGAPPTRFIDETVEKIQRQLGATVRIEIEICEDIPVPPSGKHRFVVSDVGQSK